MRKKQKSKYTSSHCHERVVLFWFFQALTLSVDGVLDEIRRSELRDQIHVLYIGILPSKMYLVTIITH